MFDSIKTMLHRNTAKDFYIPIGMTFAEVNSTNTDIWDRFVGSDAIDASNKLHGNSERDLTIPLDAFETDPSLTQYRRRATELAYAIFGEVVGLEEKSVEKAFTFKCPQVLVNGKIAVLRFGVPHIDSDYPPGLMLCESYSGPKFLQRKLDKLDFMKTRDLVQGYLVRRSALIKSQLM